MGIHDFVTDLCAFLFGVKTSNKILTMADAAPAKAAPKAKKAAKPKKPAAHPKYSEMIAAAVGALKERGGSSRQAILKYILKNFKVGPNETSVNAHLKLALKAGVKKGALKQSKGTGASGSFKLGEKPKAVKKPKAKKAAKPKKAKTPKKPKKLPRSLPLRRPSLPRRQRSQLQPNPRRPR